MSTVGLLCWPGQRGKEDIDACVGSINKIRIATMLDTIFTDATEPAALLLILSILLWLGYLGLRLSGRLRIPVVTSFMLLGVVLGPSGLGVLSVSILDALRLIEPIALGLITFSAGEQLYIRDVRNLSRQSFTGIIMETVMPIALVGALIFFLTGRLEIALPLGVIAGTTGIATVVTTLRERNAEGSLTRLTSVAIAADNVFAILVFALTLPIAIALDGGGAMSSLLLGSLVGIAASGAIGAAVGVVLGHFIAQIRSSSELSMFVLAHLLLMVAVTNLLGYSVLLAGLVMGIVAVNVSGEPRERERLFTSLGPLEIPLISVFFLWAGAGLHLEALRAVGVLTLAYIAARSLGKWLGPWLASLIPGDALDSRNLRMLGVALLPQAGAAIGLGIRARDLMPTAGEEVLTIVLAAVVVFELTGPLAIERALKAVGESEEKTTDQPMTLNEAVRELESRKGSLMVVTDQTTTLWQVASTIRLAHSLRTDLLLLPIHESEVQATPKDPTLTGGPMTDDATRLLARYASNHDLQLTTLPACTGNIVACIAEIVRHWEADLLILAWDEDYRKNFAAEVLETVACPVVELPSPAATEASEKLRPRTRRSLMSSMGRLVGKLAAQPATRKPPEDDRPPEDERG